MKQMVPESEMRLLDVTPSDLDAVIPFIRVFYTLFGYPYEEGKKRMVLEAFVADRSLGRVLLIEQGGVPIGYVLLAFTFGLEFDGRVAFVDELFIDPSRRGKGAGSEVIARVESLCLDLGMKAIRLETEADNPGATALYVRLGFRDSGRHILTKLIPGSPVES